MRLLSEHSSEEDQQFEPVNYDNADTVDFNILSDGVHVMLINDSQGVFYPLLNLAIDHFKFKFNKLFTDSICTSLLNAFASYYDSKHSEWEPLLERLKVHLMIKNGNKIVLETKNDVNLNLTTEMLSTVLQTLKILEEEETTVQVLNEYENLFGAYEVQPIASKTVKRLGTKRFLAPARR